MNKFSESEYRIIPEHMKEALLRWTRDHIPPGGFLQAVLCNDLFGASGRADTLNRFILHEYCMWLYNEAPSDCFGSCQQVYDWCKPELRDRLEFRI